MFGFVGAAWPRYYTAFDLIANALAYLPLGFLLVPALQPGLSRAFAAGMAVSIAAALSITVEALQGFLPSRVPSNLDLGCNVLGALLGALLGARYSRAFDPEGGLSRWRARRIGSGREGDIGLTLVALWLITQLNPDTPAFAVGDIRSVLGLPAPVGYSADLYRELEALAVFFGVLSIGLIAWRVMRERSAWLLALLLLVALAIRLLAWGLIVDPMEFSVWMTQGTLLGLLTGTLGLALCLLLPSPPQHMIAACALLAATVLVNVVPENPYAPALLRGSLQGHFLNFSGLTRVTSVLWPWFALAFLLAYPPQRADRQVR